MSALGHHINELKAAEAFSRQSVVFDRIYSGNSIVRYKRDRLRAHILNLVKEGASMLELNCGTGEDAVFFAGSGFSVHATDISEKMVRSAEAKFRNAGLEDKLTAETCSFTELAFLKNRGPYDAVYSNFGGLNCTSRLEVVLQSLESLVKKDGIVTLVIISPFCLWEFLMLFRGKVKTAFRRFFSRRGRTARVEGMRFTCYYYPSSFIVKQMGERFEMLSTEGLCSLVPPSYIEGFAERFPRLYRWLVKREDEWKSLWPWRNTGDYYIISFRKKY